MSFMYTNYMAVYGKSSERGKMRGGGEDIVLYKGKIINRCDALWVKRRSAPTRKIPEIAGVSTKVSVSNT